MLSRYLSSLLLTITVTTTMSANSLNHVSARTSDDGLILRMFGELDDNLQSQFYVDIDNDKSTGDSDEDTKGADYLVENDYVLKYVNGEWDEEHPIYIDTVKNDERVKSIVPYSAVGITDDSEKTIRVKAAVMDEEWEHYKSYPDENMRKVSITPTVKEEVKPLTNLTVTSDEDGIVFKMFGDIKNHPNTQFYVDSDNDQETGDSDTDTKGADYLIENDYILKYKDGEWDENNPIYLEDIDKDSKQAKVAVNYTSLGLDHSKRDIKVLAAVMDDEWDSYEAYPAQMKSFNIGKDLEEAPDETTSYIDLGSNTGLQDGNIVISDDEKRAYIGGTNGKLYIIDIEDKTDIKLLTTLSTLDIGGHKGDAVTLQADGFSKDKSKLYLSENDITCNADEWLKFVLDIQTQTIKKIDKTPDYLSSNPNEVSEKRNSYKIPKWNNISHDNKLKIELYNNYSDDWYSDQSGISIIDNTNQQKLIDFKLTDSDEVLYVSKMVFSQDDKQLIVTADKQISSSNHEYRGFIYTIDVSNPSNPYIITKLQLEDELFNTAESRLSDDETKIYAKTVYDKKLIIIDISDFEHPKAIKTVKSTLKGTNNTRNIRDFRVSPDGKKLYLMGYDYFEVISL